MITSPTTEIVEKLLNLEGGARLSIYMPTHRAGADIWQDPIRCKNLIREANEKLLALEGTGSSGNDIRGLLRPLAELQENREFWQHQGDGLAIFRAADTIEIFRVPVELPELCVVAPRFHLKPLLMALAAERPFHVLSLSQNAVKLFRGSAAGLTEVDLDFDSSEPSRPSDRNNTLRAQATVSGAHLMNVPEFDQKAHLAAFCRKVDHAVAARVQPHDLLILAAVDYVGNIYRDVSTLRGIAAKSVHGNPETVSVAQLHAAAIVIAREEFDQTRLTHTDRFFASQRQGKALDDPAAAIQAARQGRVDTVFVPIGVHVWGRLNSDGNAELAAQAGPQDEDLLNRILIDTWKAGGRVFALPPDQIPGGGLVAAMTRY